MDLTVYPLTCKQGSKFQFFFTWKVKNAQGVFAPVNLSGYTARFQVRRDENSTTTLVDLTTENGGITLGGSAGTVDIRIAYTVTAGLPLGVWTYDFDIIDPSSAPDRMLEGTFEVVR